MELVWHYIPSKLFIFLHFCIVPPCFTTGPLVPCQTHQISGVPGSTPWLCRLELQKLSKLSQVSLEELQCFFPGFCTSIWPFWFLIHPDYSSWFILFAMVNAYWTNNSWDSRTTLWTPWTPLPNCPAPKGAEGWGKEHPQRDGWLVPGRKGMKRIHHP
jgi:hypothetical protein